MADLETRFKAAAESVKTFSPSKTVPDAEKLRVYALFKQATVGDNNTSRPWVDPVGKAKFDAWEALKGKSKDEAMAEYIAEVERQHRDYA